jgi:hypothetical protein
MEQRGRSGYHTVDLVRFLLFILYRSNFFVLPFLLRPAACHGGRPTSASPDALSAGAIILLVALLATLEASSTIRFLRSSTVNPVGCAVCPQISKWQRVVVHM